MVERMKNKWVTAWITAFMITMGGTAFAASASFNDVPKDHWAYGAVNKLEKAGLIEGYGDGNYRGDYAITRYEFAVLITKALENYDKADASNKAEMDKLSQEFVVELNTLGTRVSKVENKVGKFKFNGDFRLRNEWAPGGDALTSWPGGVGSRTAKSMTKERYQIKITNDIDKNLSTYTALLFSPGMTGDRTYNNTDGGAPGNPSASTTVDAMYLNYNAPDGTNYKLGRNYLRIGQGLLWDTAHMSGAQITFGNKLRTTIDTHSFISKTWYAASSKYTVNKDLQLTFGYLQDKDKDWYNSSSIGFIYQVSPEFKLSSEYGVNDNAKINVNNGRPGKLKASNITLKYGNAVPTKVGSSDFFVTYKKAEKGFDTQYGSTWTMIAPYPGGMADDLKGYEYGFEYTPFTNATITILYDPLTSYDGKTDKKFLRTELLIRF